MSQARKQTASPQLNPNVIGALQQEIDLGVQALRQGNADVAVTFFQSALSKMSPEMEYYDHLVHNLLLSYKAIIEKLFAAGDEETASGFLRSALKLEIAGDMAGDIPFRHGFADAFHSISLSCFDHRHFQASLQSCRKALSIHRDPSYYVTLTNALSVSGLPSMLSDYTSDLVPEQLGRHIFIACAPKSGSTFLKNVLARVTGYRDIFTVYAAGQSEHELYLPTINAYAAYNTVTQQHCRASDANIQMMNAFGIRPIVLVRDIFDSVISLLDFYNIQGAFFNTYFRADFPDLDEETKIDLLIDNVLPWYFQFVASWDLAEKQQRIDIKWLRYEDMISDKAGTTIDLLNFYGLGAPAKAVEGSIAEIESEGRKIRFNKGVAGRGKAGLSDRQKEKIRRFSRYYPSADLGRIGL